MEKLKNLVVCLEELNVIKENYYSKLLEAKTLLSNLDDEVQHIINQPRFYFDDFEIDN